MASVIDICRLALGHVADAAKVNNIAPPDPSAQAQHCATFYPIARDEMLAEAPWPFAKRTTQLAQSVVADTGRWAYAYQVPHDYLRAVEVYPQGYHPGARPELPRAPFEYVIQTDASEQDLVIFTNFPDAELTYLYREENTGRYTPLAVSALSYLLGSYLAGPIIKGRVGAQVKASLANMYRTLVDKAIVRDVGASDSASQSYGYFRPSWVSDR